MKNKKQIKKICRNCGETFYSQPHKAERPFCSRRCSGLYHRKEMVEIVCLNCEKIFKVKPSIKEKKNRRFCCMECFYEYVKIVVECLNCGKEIVTTKSTPRKYCCRECFFTHKKGLFNTKPERELEKILTENEIEYEKQFKIIDDLKEYADNRKRIKLFDFFIPNKNLLIEVDGVYWHSKNLLKNEMNEIQLGIKERDKYKEHLAEEKGYNLMRVWEDEIENINVKELINYE